MSRLLEQELNRFLSSAEAEVLCIRGPWGVGKTFAWNRILAEASKKQTIALESYCYVSLFGLDSLDDLKHAIFENVVAANVVGEVPTFDSIRANAAKALRTGTGFLSKTPLVMNYAGGLRPLLYKNISRTIVCIDDLERRGKNLRIRDVMGLISHLKERQSCKVVIVYNEDEIGGEDDQKDFKQYFEKVVDAHIEYSPSSAESTRIAVDASTTTGQAISKHCVSLGISNIRVIKKIEKSVSRVLPLLAGLDPQIAVQAIHTIALLGWVQFEPGRAPTMDFLINRRPKQLFALKKPEPGEQTVQESVWNELLTKYNFTTLDEFDNALFLGIQTGVFDDDLVGAAAKKLGERLLKAKGSDAFHQAWRMFHDSFSDNQNDVLAALKSAVDQSPYEVSPVNLNSTVKLIKDLGQPDLARALIANYVAARNEDRDFFDPQQSPFGMELDDPDLLEAFSAKRQSFKDSQSPIQILRKLARSGGWSRQDIETLSKLTDEDFIKVFKEINGPELTEVVRASLQFSGYAGVDEQTLKIATNAKSALSKIASESEINRLRIKKFGVLN